MPSYSEDELPPASINVNGRDWQREKVDSHAYQWSRPLEEDEYDWDEEEVEVVGIDRPVRSVTLRLDGDTWIIEAAETAGPDYHRPGFTELISPDFSSSVEELKDATETVRTYLDRLSYPLSAPLLNLASFSDLNCALHHKVTGEW